MRARSAVYACFSGLFASQASAQAVDIHNPLVACYLAQAAIIGTVRCADPASLLVGSVFGRCDGEEQAAIAGSLPPPPSDYDRQRQADIALRRVRERMSPIIQSWIVGAQVGSPDCPHY